MAITFRLTKHTIWPDTQIVEVIENDLVIGVIYPQPDKTIKLASAHIEKQEREEGFAGDLVIDDGSRSWPPIPFINIKFNPSPYRIVGNKIIKDRIH